MFQRWKKRWGFYRIVSEWAPITWPYAIHCLAVCWKSNRLLPDTKTSPERTPCDRCSSQARVIEQHPCHPHYTPHRWGASNPLSSYYCAHPPIITLASSPSPPIRTSQPLTMLGCHFCRKPRKSLNRAKQSFSYYCAHPPIITLSSSPSPLKGLNSQWHWDWMGTKSSFSCYCAQPKVLSQHRNNFLPIIVLSAQLEFLKQHYNNHNNKNDNSHLYWAICLGLLFRAAQGKTDKK